MNTFLKVISKFIFLFLIICTMPFVMIVAAYNAASNMLENFLDDITRD